MNSKKSLLVIVGVLVAILAGAGVGYAALSNGSGSGGPAATSAATGTAASSAATSGAASASAGTATSGAASGPTEAAASGATSASAGTTSSADPNATNSQNQTAAEVLNGGMGEAKLEPTGFILPEFMVYDQSGAEVLRSSLNGKPSVVGYWATWCPPCMQEVPEIQALWEKYGDQINLLMINVTDGSRETAEGVRSWYEAQDINYPIYLDTTGQASAAGNARYLPIMHFLDADGNVMYSQIGALTEAEASHIIDALLSME